MRSICRASRRRRPDQGLRRYLCRYLCRSLYRSLYRSLCRHLCRLGHCSAKVATKAATKVPNGASCHWLSKLQSCAPPHARLDFAAPSAQKQWQGASGPGQLLCPVARAVRRGGRPARGPGLAARTAPADHLAAPAIAPRATQDLRRPTGAHPSSGFPQCRRRAGFPGRDRAGR